MARISDKDRTDRTSDLVILFPDRIKVVVQGSRQMMLPFHAPSLGWRGEEGLHHRPHIGENGRNAVILQVGRSIPMAVREKDPPVVQVVQQFQVPATGKVAYPRFPPLEEFLEVPGLLGSEGHFHDPYQHGR